MAGPPDDKNQYRFGATINRVLDTRRHKISQQVGAPQPRTGMARIKMADAGENELLAGLTAPELDRLRPHLEATEVAVGQILHEAGQ